MREDVSIIQYRIVIGHWEEGSIGEAISLTLADLGTKGDVLSCGALDLLLGRHRGRLSFVCW